MNSLLDILSKHGLVRKIVHATPVSFLIIDEDYRLLFASDYHMQLYDYNPDHIIGAHCYDVTNGGVCCARCVVRQVLETGEKALVQRRDVLDGGQVCFVDDYAIPLPPDESGKRRVLEIMVDRTSEMTARARRDRRQSEILSILSSLIDAKDRYTALHSQNVQTISMRIARAMGLSDSLLFELSYAAILHDIGKVHIPNEILNKPDRLTDDEYETIKAHSVYSYAMLSGFATLNDIRMAVRAHHERFDGRGYPDHLSGNQIPLTARIIAVADTYDAMTSTRPYRRALSHEYAMEEIRRAAGTQLCPDVVKVFLRMDFTDSPKTEASTPDAIERELDVPAYYKRNADAHSAEPVRLIDRYDVADAMLEHTPCGYLLTDANHNILYANPYFIQYMGIEREEILNCNCAQLKGRNAGCARCPLMRHDQTENAPPMRRHQCNADGLRAFDAMSVPWHDERGELQYILKVLIDRTGSALHDRQKALDFEQLADMLEQLARKHMQGDDRMAEELAVLRIRLQALKEMAP